MTNLWQFYQNGVLQQDLLAVSHVMSNNQNRTGQVMALGSAQVTVNDIFDLRVVRLGTNNPSIFMRAGEQFVVELRRMS